MADARMPAEADVVVLGGGPAGAAAARRMALAGLRVALIERSHYETERVGECLPPKAGALLSALGIPEPAAPHMRIAASGVQSSWSEDEAAASRLYSDPHGDGWNVDRRRFDAMLARLAADAGANLHQGTRVVHADHRDGRWSIDLDNGRRVDRISAGFAVDATGRSAWLARQRGACWTGGPPLVGLFAHLPDSNGDPRIWLESSAAGWWYAAPLPGGRMVVVHLTDGDLLPPGRAAAERLFREALSQTVHVRRRCDDLAAAQINLAPASGGRLDRFHGDGWLAVGDAAAATEPLGGTGVCRALEWGDRGGSAVVANLAGDSEALSAHGDALAALHREAVFSQTAQYAQAVSRWPDSPFWSRRHRLLRDAVASSLPASTVAAARSSSAPQTPHERGNEHA